MWKFLVKNQSIEIMEREVLADHQIQYVQFKFTFDGNWKHYHKTVQFSQCDEVFNVVLGYLLDDEYQGGLCLSSEHRLRERL